MELSVTIDPARRDTARQVEQHIVHNDAGAAACSAQAVQPRRNTGHHIGNVAEQCCRRFGGRPASVQLDAEQRVATGPVVADLAANQTAKDIRPGARNGISDEVDAGCANANACEAAIGTTLSGMASDASLVSKASK